MVAGDPVGIREVDLAAHYAVAGLVVDLPGRALDLAERDVLVEAARHAVREPEPAGVERVELGSRDLVLPGDDLVEPLGLGERDRGGELAHAEVEAGRA